LEIWLTSLQVGVHVDDGQLAEALSTVLEGIPNPRLRQLLLDDISSLVPMFAGLAGETCAVTARLMMSILSGIALTHMVR